MSTVEEKVEIPSKFRKLTNNWRVVSIIPPAIGIIAGIIYTFQEGNPVVLEGSLNASGVFQAKSLMVKCPSKYEPTVEAPFTNGINSWQT